MEAAGQTGSILGKHPAPDESNQQSLKKSCADGGTNQGKQVQKVKFINSTTNSFTITLYNAQRIKGWCCICHEDKLTNYPICQLNDRHVVCVSCIETYINTPRLSTCPQCRGQKADDRYISDNLRHYKLELNNSDIRCDECPKSFSFTEAQTHSHREPPSEAPFSYHPGRNKTKTVQTTNSTPQNVVQNKTAEKITSGIMAQIKNHDPTIFLVWAAFFETLIQDSSEWQELFSQNLRVKLYCDNVDIPFTITPIMIFKELFQTYFDYRERTQHPITLEDIQAVFRGMGENTLADALVWPDE